MLENWAKIPEFPNYSVSDLGRIRNEDYGRIIKISKTKQGGAKVGLVLGGKQHTRSVKVLVAEAFVDGYTERFNTPINLDGNQHNNVASNLLWRPRWFAWKYHHQFEEADRYFKMGPVINRKTGIIYKTIFDAATKNGLLFYDVLSSAINQDPVFPTWEYFDWG